MANSSSLLEENMINNFSNIFSAGDISEIVALFFSGEEKQELKKHVDLVSRDYSWVSGIKEASIDALLANAITRLNRHNTRDLSSKPSGIFKGNSDIIVPLELVYRFEGTWLPLLSKNVEQYSS